MGLRRARHARRSTLPPRPGRHERRRRGCRGPCVALVTRRRRDCRQRHSRATPAAGHSPAASTICSGSREPRLGFRSRTTPSSPTFSRSGRSAAFEAEMPGYFAHARVVVVGGTTRERTIAVLREFTDNIIRRRRSRPRTARPGEDQPGDRDRCRDRRVRVWRRFPASSRSRSPARSTGSATRSPMSPFRTPTSSSAR